MGLDSHDNGVRICIPNFTRPKVRCRFHCIDASGLRNSDSLLKYLPGRQDGEVEWMLVSDNKPVLSHACCETGGMSLGLLMMFFLLRVAAAR